MRSVWGSLEACIKAQGELHVRPCRREVQKEANHAHVLFLISCFTMFIWIHHRCRAHRCRHGLELSNVELLHQINRVLGLMYEGTLLRLLDLDT
jgi:hypothetical protein